MKTFTTEEEIDAIDEVGDILDAWMNGNVDDCNPVVVEATAKELAEMGVGTGCGDVPNTAFAGIAKEYPDVLIRTCLLDEDGARVSSSCLIHIQSVQEGIRIVELCGEAGGSLRFEDAVYKEHFEDGDNPEEEYQQALKEAEQDFISGWNYFETE